MRPNTLAEAVEAIQAGSPRDVVLAEFVDTFDLAKTDEDRYASIEREPKLTGDAGLTRSWARSPNIWRSSAGWGVFRIGSADPARRLDRPWFTTANAVGRHARIPDLQQSRRVRVAQHFHRRTAAATRARPSSIQAIGHHDHRHRRTGGIRQGHARQAARSPLRLSPPRYRRDLPRGGEGAAGCGASISPTRRGRWRLRWSSIPKNSAIPS